MLNRVGLTRLAFAVAGHGNGANSSILAATARSAQQVFALVRSNATTTGPSPYEAKRNMPHKEAIHHQWESAYVSNAKFIHKSGIDVCYDPLLNKGTAFSYPERDRLGIRGLLPPKYANIEVQLERLRLRYEALKDPLEKYLFLVAVQDRNETLFYRFLMSNLEQMAPIIYTPTVGLACQKFATIYRRPRGMYFSCEDKGSMLAMVYNNPGSEVDVAVITDGGRVLGLGDLGTNAMPIPIGKLSLYVAAGGIHPGRVLPVCIDVGTNNQSLLEDPMYLGLNRKRLDGPEYYEVIDEVITAIRTRWPNVLIQFEDFTPDKAYPLLQKYRKAFTCFNDDIQGTGSVILSGLLNAVRAQGKPISELGKQRILAVGGGCAGMGVCDAIMEGMKRETGLTAEQAAAQFLIFDKDGVITTNRKFFAPGQEKYARKDMGDGNMTLLEAVQKFKPDALLGLSGVGGIFSEEVIREMAKQKARPIIMPLSNPTSRSECTFEQAVEWSDGRCIFASGSPYDPVVYKGTTIKPSQGNNMYTYPGVGLGAVLCKARIVSDDMLYAASRTLAMYLSDDEVMSGRIYPPVNKIRDVSKKIAVAVIKQAKAEGLDQNYIDDDGIEEYVESNMFQPVYEPIVYLGK